MVYVHVAHGARSARERRRIVTAFRAAGAMAPESAAPLSRLGLSDDRFFRRFCERRIIREVKAGEFYLDLDALREFERAMLRWIAVPIALFIALMVWLIAGGGR